MNTVGKSLDHEVAESASAPERPSRQGGWIAEKSDLLRTHRSWFVAYQDGRRVALEPSLERLVAALEAKLGKPRRPCEFHEIVEKPARRRGPSPRLAAQRRDAVEHP